LGLKRHSPSVEEHFSLVFRAIFAFVPNPLIFLLLELHQVPARSISIRRLLVDAKPALELPAILVESRRIVVPQVAQHHFVVEQTRRGYRYRQKRESHYARL
jgi:hypothetical protein